MTDRQLMKLAADYVQETYGETQVSPYAPSESENDTYTVKVITGNWTYTVIVENGTITECSRK